MKMHPTIGCCGIDCGLCPRFSTRGASRCPGCLGKNFRKHHPSCSIVTCCFAAGNHETCADCQEFPCSKLEEWDQADSFVTHRVSLQNLRNIRRDGIETFTRQQEHRMELLRTLLEEYDDGRSKSCFCLSAALLPIDSIVAAIEEVKRSKGAIDRKRCAEALRNAFAEIGRTRSVDLTYRKKA